MKYSKRILRWLPEIYFIFFAIWWAVSLYKDPHEIINYPAILLACVLLLQLIIKNRVIGLIVSVLLATGSAYLILALWSDLAKKPVFDEGGFHFLLKAGSLITVNIFMSLLMFRNYYNTGRKPHVEAGYNN